MRVESISTALDRPKKKGGKAKTKTKALRRFAQASHNLGLKKAGKGGKGGRGPAAAAAATIALAPVVLFAAQRIIESRARRGLAAASAGVLMQTSGNKSVSASGRVLIVGGLVLTLWDGLEKLFGADRGVPGAAPAPASAPQGTGK